MISESPFLNNVTYLCIGMVIGLILGWMSRAVKYAKDARDHADKAATESAATRKMVEKIMDEQKDEDGYANERTVNRVMLFISVAITAVAAFIANNAVGQMHQGQVCTEQVLAHVIHSVNVRTQYTGGINKASKQKDEAFAALVSASLRKPPPNKKEARIIVTNYSKKLNHYLYLITQSDKARVSNPYPTVHDYFDCIDN